MDLVLFPVSLISTCSEFDCRLRSNESDGCLAIRCGYSLGILLKNH